MAQPREYDPEIKDIADYVANKPIDSDLAVSNPLPLALLTLLPRVVPARASKIL
jgi:2-methylcitrate dehydratase